MKSTIREYVLLRPLYQRVLRGLPLLGTPQKAAAGVSGEPQAAAADQLITRYTTLCGTTGFVTGLPGFLGQIVMLPADVAGVALLQLHLCAAIAVLSGRDPNDPAVRDLCIDCLLGEVAPHGEEDEKKEAKKRFGLRAATFGVRFAAERSLKFVTSKAARRLPILGGILGGASDVVMTRRVGHMAKQVFLEQKQLLEPTAAPPAASSQAAEADTATRPSA